MTQREMKAKAMIGYDPAMFSTKNPCFITLKSGKRKVGSYPALLAFLLRNKYV